jgi:CRP/FNR family transcriptional regulator, cyclic AMP receptor protein
VRLGRDAKIDLIAGVPLFARCSRKELAEVASIADEVELPEGRVLIKQGDSASEFFVLLDGRAEVEKNGKPVRELGAGDFFGEIALISHVPRTATVRAATTVRALVIRSPEFRALLDHSPRVLIGVLEVLADRLAPDSI